MLPYPVSVSFGWERIKGIIIKSWKEWVLQLNLEKPAHSCSPWCCSCIVADWLQAVTAGRHWNNLSYKLEWAAEKKTEPTSSYHPLRLADTLANRPRLITQHAKAMAAVMKRCSGWARSLAPVIPSAYPSPSASVSTAHISAHTSKVALLRKLPEGWIHNISCGFKWVQVQVIRINRISAVQFRWGSSVIWSFSLLVVVVAAGLVISSWWSLDYSLLKHTSCTRWGVFSVFRPSKSLNILHHLLKKLTGWVVK